MKACLCIYLHFHCALATSMLSNPQWQNCDVYSKMVYGLLWFLWIFFTLPHFTSEPLPLFLFIHGFIAHLPHLLSFAASFLLTAVLWFLLPRFNYKKNSVFFFCTRMKRNITMPYLGLTCLLKKYTGRLFFLLPQPSSCSSCFFQFNEPVVWNQTCDLFPINVNVLF